MACDVVIAGGGFGGLYAARRLERRLPGHPPSLGACLDDAARPGELPSHPHGEE